MTASQSLFTKSCIKPFGAFSEDLEVLRQDGLSMFIRKGTAEFTVPSGEKGCYGQGNVLLLEDSVSKTLNN